MKVVCEALIVRLLSPDLKAVCSPPPDPVPHAPNSSASPAELPMTHSSAVMSDGVSVSPVKVEEPLPPPVDRCT